MGFEFGLFCGDNSVAIIWEDGSISVLLNNKAGLHLLISSADKARFTRIKYALSMPWSILQNNGYHEGKKIIISCDCP